MIRRNFIFPSLLVASCLFLLSACGPAAIPTPEKMIQTVEVPKEVAMTKAPAALACPPIPVQASASLPGESTKITIPAGAIALTDPGAKAWCDTSQLKLAKVSLSNLVSTQGCFTDQNDKTYPCSVYNALAAVDIQPGRIKFPASLRPALVYDLSKTESKPYCTVKSADCGGYAIYRLIKPLPPTPNLAWRYISPASLVSGAKPAAAEGINIDQFSTMALVELPPPQMFPPMTTAAMVVASEFLPDEPDNQNIFTVALLIRDDTLGMNGQTRIFRFSNPEIQLAVTGAYPAECLDAEIYPTIPEQLTCLFPADMEVILVNGVDNVAYQISIAPLSGGYEARLFAKLEVH